MTPDSAEGDALTASRLQSVLAGRYTIERVLGRGGMATVYLAHDLKHDRRVAIKVLRPELTAILGADRFLREVATTARLAHPCILPLFDSGTEEGISWYAMPLITGKTLRDRLAEAGALSLEEARRIFSDVAGALDHAHRHGVLHRDLKPANILLQDERALLADFGIALPVGNRDDRLTETGISLGTPEYMSPEQAMGDRALDARSDVYALGCVLYEMLAGEAPFTAPTAQAVLARRLMEPAPRLATLRTLPPTIDLAVSRALERNRADRFPTVGEFAAAVAREAGRTGPSTRVVPTFRGRHWSAIAAVLGLAAVILGARWVLSRQPSTDRRGRAAYLQAQSHLGRRTQDGLMKAVRLLQQAISRDSNDALAWAGLAEALGWAGTWRFTVEGVPAESLLARQLEASDRALALDSTNADMWLLKARIASAIDPTTRAPAINSLRQQLVIDSLSGKGWNALGFALEETGDRAGALAAMRRGVMMGGNPVNLANHYYWWREFDSAAVWADSAVVIDPRLAWTHETVGGIALAQGRLSQAQAAYEAARRLDAGPTRVRSLEGLAEGGGKTGRRENGPGADSGGRGRNRFNQPE